MKKPRSNGSSSKTIRFNLIKFSDQLDVYGLFRKQAYFVVVQYGSKVLTKKLKKFILLYKLKFLLDFEKKNTPILYIIEGGLTCFFFIVQCGSKVLPQKPKTFILVYKSQFLLDNEKKIIPNLYILEEGLICFFCNCTVWFKKFTSKTDFFLFNYTCRIVCSILKKESHRTYNYIYQRKV